MRALSQRCARGRLWAAGSLIRGRKDKEWSDCVQVDVQAVGTTQDWKATALEAEVWIKTVTEGGRRLMVTWMNGKVDTA